MSISIVVNIRLNKSDGNLKAYADTEIRFDASVLSIHGLRVVETDPEKGPWVTYPQQKGKDGKKWYDVVKITGKLHNEISSAVLKEYTDVKLTENRPSAVPRAQIPREPGEERVP